VKLQETPLSLDQKIGENVDGSWIVNATVPDCHAFDWWVMSMGGNIFHTAPHVPGDSAL
jgi:hypothetical protein